MLRFLTAGESHGQALLVVLEGIPAGLELDLPRLDDELRRRQAGYGRGRRMQIEQDRAEVLSGVRGTTTIGSPIAIAIRNRDWENWRQTMFIGPPPPPETPGARRAPVTRPRPGHADLAGALKLDRRDMRDVLERASARETAARVAAGAVARQLLLAAGIEVTSHVVRIGAVTIERPEDVGFDDAYTLADDSPFRCADRAREADMVTAVDAARAAGDTLGGSFEVIARGVPPGLGSHTQWDLRLDGRLAQALMSIPAIKAVGIGLGAAVAARPGSQVHDEILPAGADRPGRWPLAVERPTNHAGGIEGGISNGEDVRVTAHMKPISTLMKPLRSVDLSTLQPSPAAIERSDVCAVPAAAVVGEAMVCLTLAGALVERFGGDSMPALRAALERERARLAAWPAGGRS
jgi:chorismate synthase